MLFLLSPAKSLDYETPPLIQTHTQPVFAKKSAELIALLKTQTTQQISSLMKLSASLADLNVARYQVWSSRFTAHNSKQAVMAFNGDVYEGLNAKTLSAGQLDWAQDHLCILSGLYGVLRPLDWMQPYRLEMGTRLITPRGSNLYQFWGEQISTYLNERAAADTLPVIVNLASEEYFKVVDQPTLKPRVVHCVFEEYKAGERGGGYKIISFHAKRARGLMARYAIVNRLSAIEKLQGFNAEGYRFDAAASSLERFVFRRRQGDAALAV